MQFASLHALDNVRRPKTYIIYISSGTFFFLKKSKFTYLRHEGISVFLLIADVADDSGTYFESLRIELSAWYLSNK